MGRLRTEVPSLEAVELLLPRARVHLRVPRRAVAGPRRGGLRAGRGGRRPRPDRGARGRRARRRAAGRRHRVAGSACGACARRSPRRSRRPASRTSSTSACRSPRLAEFLERVPPASRRRRRARGRSSSAISATATSTSTCSGRSPTTRRADEAVLRLAAEVGGTISAEHGVGVAKARWLHLHPQRRRDRGHAVDQARARPRWRAEPRRYAPWDGFARCVRHDALSDSPPLETSPHDPLPPARPRGAACADRPRPRGVRLGRRLRHVDVGLHVRGDVGRRHGTPLPTRARPTSSRSSTPAS